MSMTGILNRGMQRYIADSNSALLGLQPEDWLEMATPVNIPGTSTEYPNWRRKLSVTLEQMFADERVNKLIKDLDKRRKAASKKSRLLITSCRALLCAAKSISDKKAGPLHADRPFSVAGVTLHHHPQQQTAHRGRRLR